MKYLLVDFIGRDDFGFSHIGDVGDFIVNRWQESLEKGTISNDCSCQEFYEENYTLYVEDNKLSFDNASELN